MLYGGKVPQNNDYRKEDSPSEIAATPWVNFGEFTYDLLTGGSSRHEDYDLELR